MIIPCADCCVQCVNYKLSKRTGHDFIIEFQWTYNWVLNLFIVNFQKYMYWIELLMIFSQVSLIESVTTYLYMSSNRLTRTIPTMCHTSQSGLVILYFTPNQYYYWWHSVTQWFLPRYNYIHIQCPILLQLDNLLWPSWRSSQFNHSTNCQ